MGEFKDGSLWMKLAFLMITIGIILDLFGFAAGASDGWNDVRACLVIGYLCFLVAFVLALCLIFLDELKGNKIALICFVVFALVAGLMTIIGVALWGGNHGRNNNNNNAGVATYAAMLMVTGGLVAILAGIFGILEIVGVEA